VATGTHNTCFQQVQDDMSQGRSVNKDWEFVSKGTEISLGKVVPEIFTPGYVYGQGYQLIREKLHSDSLRYSGCTSAHH
jgi:hypothetical protein